MPESRGSAFLPCALSLLPGETVSSPQEERDTGSFPPESTQVTRNFDPTTHGCVCEGHRRAR